MKYLALLHFVGIALMATHSAHADTHQTKPLNCRNFDSIEQQSAWWEAEYGSIITIGALHLDEQQNTTHRVGQLFLLLRELQKTGKSDLQKHLAIEAELHSVLGKEYEDDQTSVFGALGQSIQLELGFEYSNTQKMRQCAFECPSAPDGGLSVGFLACLEK